MSKILALKQDYRDYSNNNFYTTPKKKINQTPSFCKGLNEEAVKMILSGTEAHLNKKHSFINPVFQFFSDTSGEIQNQLVNATFTTTLAPFFIAFNPFSKQDEKTRHYTAWRQPISAIIAIGTSWPLTIMTNNFWDNLHNEGYAGFIDLRMSPTKEKYKKPYKDAFKDAKAQGKLKEFLAANEPEDLSEAIKEHRFYKWSSSKPTLSYKRACFNNYVKKQQAERQALFAKIISADPKTLTAKDGIIYVNNEALNAGKPIPNMETTEKLNKYLQKHSLYNRKVSDLMKEKFKFMFFEEKDGAWAKGRFLPEIVKKNLSEVTAIDFLSKMGIIDKKDVSESDLLKTILDERQLKYAEKLAKDLHITKDEAIRVYALIGQDTSRNVQMAVGEVQGKAETLSLGQFFHQVGFKDKDGTLQKLMDMNMVDALETFRKIFAGKLKGFDSKTNMDTFAKRIIKMMADDLGKTAKNDTKFAGIVFNVFITAFSCTVLNWAYPRFMERFRPDLCSDNEAKKGGNK